MLIRDDKSRILPARTCSLRTTRLVPSAAPLVVTATTRGSGTGVPPVTAEDTEHGDLKPAPDPAAGESRSRAWRTLQAGLSQAAEGPSPPAGLLGDGRWRQRQCGVCRAPGPSSPRSLVQPCAPAPSAAAALSSAPRLRVPSPGALRLSHCVSRVPCLAPARSSAGVPRRLALAVRSDTPGARRGYAAWSVLLLPSAPGPASGWPSPRGRGHPAASASCCWGRAPVTSSWALSPAPACRPAGRPAAPRPRRSLLRASPPARPVSLERAVSSSPRAKRSASDGGSGGRLGSALLTLHSIRGTNVARSNKTLFTGTGRARFRPQASFLAPAVLPTARVVTSACRCDFRHSVCSLKSPARIPWRSV